VFLKLLASLGVQTRTAPNTCTTIFDQIFAKYLKQTTPFGQLCLLLTFLLLCSLSGATKNQFRAHYQAWQLDFIIYSYLPFDRFAWLPSKTEKSRWKMGKARGFKIAQGVPSKMTAVRLSQAADKSK